MPFSRPRTVLVAVLATLAVATLGAPAPARAELAATSGIVDATPRLIDTVLPARTQPTAPAADAATFCPVPTGHWWDDLAVHGCVELLAGRDRTAPVTATELAWLDLGDLPASAHADLDAIATFLTERAERLEQERLAAEAEAAEQARQQQSRTPGTRTTRTTRTTGGAGGGTPSSSSWGSGAPRGGSGGDPELTPEAAAYEACLAAISQPDEMFGSPAWDAFWATHTACVDRQSPGYAARWAKEQAAWQAQLDEWRVLEDAARARLAERQARALQQVRDTCPHGGFAAPTQFMVSSYDQIEYEVVCNDGPNG